MPGGDRQGGGQEAGEETEDGGEKRPTGGGMEEEGGGAEGGRIGPDEVDEGKSLERTRRGEEGASVLRT